MLEQTVTQVGEALVDAAMTMAFVSLEPSAEAPACGGMVVARIGLTGLPYTAVELMAPRELGALIAGNMLGCDPSDEMAATRAVDALRELLNVTCGQLLQHPHLARLGGEMGIPQVQMLSDADAVRQWLDAAGYQAFNAEGHLVAIRLTGGNG